MSRETAIAEKTEMIEAGIGLLEKVISHPEKVLCDAENWTLFTD